MSVVMITLSEDVETLARRLAAVDRTTVEDAIRRALEDRAQARGVGPAMHSWRSGPKSRPCRCSTRARPVGFRALQQGIHPGARLNLADCAAYALAATMRAPLLFKGEDFSETDVELCSLE